MNYLYLFTLFVLLIGTSCSNTDESTTSNSSRVAIIAVDGDEIFLDEIEAVPPTEDEKKNLILTKFHKQLSYLVELKVWEKVQGRWDVSFKDEDILIFKKDFFDKFKIDRDQLEKQVEDGKLMVKTIELFLDGVEPKAIYEKYREQIPYRYEDWKRVFLKDKSWAEKTRNNFQKGIEYFEGLLQKNDEEIRQTFISQSLESMRPAYLRMLIGKEICNSKNIPVAGDSESNLPLNNECVDVAADWLNDYMKKHVKVLNPIAKDYAFSVNFGGSLVGLQGYK